MARIRSIKPEFWTSAQVLECSANARLLFIGLWNFADDAGRHPDSPKQAKAEVYPADDLTLDDVAKMLDELERVGLITRYMVDGVGYFKITGWKHQRIDKPQPAKYPEPIQEHSKSIPRTLPPDKIRYDTNGKDSNGAKSADTYAPDFEQAWSEYPKRAGGNPKRSAMQAWKARLMEGELPQDIIDGVRRYAQYIQATGKERTEFVKQAKSFFGPDKHYLEDWTLPEQKHEASRKLSAVERVEANIAARYSQG
jgi:hypothetical protein